MIMSLKKIFTIKEAGDEPGFDPQRADKIKDMVWQALRGRVEIEPVSATSLFYNIYIDGEHHVVDFKAEFDEDFNLVDIWPG
jgi:hypothetical protein